jgi:hypothetical protein
MTSPAQAQLGAIKSQVPGQLIGKLGRMGQSGQVATLDLVDVEAETIPRDPALEVQREEPDRRTSPAPPSMTTANSA